jgi:very-short-patch-repair endonuclease
VSWLDSMSLPDDFLALIPWPYRTGIVPRAPLSAETRAKISASLRGKKKAPMSKESRDKQAAALRGRPRPEEVNKKVSESLTGRKLSEAHKAKLRRPVSAETKEKLSQALRGRKSYTATEVNRANMSRARRAWMASLTEDQRAQHAEQSAKNLRNPRYSNTGLERRAAEILEEHGIAYVPQKHFGRFRVDFYLPQFSIALEVDGTYWHTRSERQAYDVNRDLEIANRFGVEVVRVEEISLVDALEGLIAKLTRQHSIEAEAEYGKGSRRERR